MTTTTTAPRLHVSARTEDAVFGALRRVAIRRGWTARVTASVGYGGPEVVRVFARVTLAPPVEPGTDARQPDRPTAPRGWRSLLTLPAVRTTVTVTLAGQAHELTADRGGYVHAQIPAVLSPGWHEASIDVAGRDPVTARLRIVGADERHGVVSDIDDTILVTWVPRRLLALWNTFILREHARRPVPGMSELLRHLAGEHGFIVYLSTGAWNFAAHLERFLVEHEFPPGPMFLTDWGPTEDGWFRSGAAHKRAMLERLRAEHPNTRWVLVGDDGQRDPEVYSEFARAHPEAVEAVLIRRLTRTQQVLAAAQPKPSDAGGLSESSAVSAPWFTGFDGHELAAAFASIGTTRHT